jgi:hypothetical protein
MSETEWQELLQLVPPATLKDYQRIREELLANKSGNASNQSLRAYAESVAQGCALFIPICQAEPAEGTSLKPMSFRPLASCSKSSISKPKTWA